MQAAYVDKYEEELRTAIEKAERITEEIEICVPYFRYVGATIRDENAESVTHYYCNDRNGKYYYESEFAKQMRIMKRQRRLQRFAKK